MSATHRGGAARWPRVHLRLGLRVLALPVLLAPFLPIATSGRAAAVGQAISMHDTPSGGIFQPSSLTVPVGTKVTWTNAGQKLHNTTSTNTPAGATAWNAYVPSGASYDVTLTVAGDYSYVCTLHAGMAGTITVTPASNPTNTPTATPAPITVVPTSTPIPTPTVASGGGAYSVTIANSLYAPDSLRVPVGATVSWTNQDQVPHTATSDTGVNPSFDTGFLSQGQTSKSITFTQAGSFLYHCAVHPYMHATIYVGDVPTLPPTSTATPSPTPTSTPTGTPTLTPTLASGGPHSVTVRDFAFDPGSLSVDVGTKVTWTNVGQAPHTVTSDTAGLFDSGDLAPGGSFTYTFAQVGAFTYFCKYHPNMHGTIVVGGAATPTPTVTPTVTPTAALTPLVTASQQQGGAAAPSSASISISNFAFQPASVTVAVGAVVTWINQDAVPHTVTSDAGVTPAFDSGMLKQGQSYSVTFKQAGTFTYYCAVHPNMHGSVVVVLPGSVQAGPAGQSATSQTAASQPATGAGVAGATAAVPGAAPVGAAPAMLHDERYFVATGFRIDDDAIFDYFQHRGGVDVFGYPVSRPFMFMGCRMQLFQRKAAQACVGQPEPAFMNLLDPDFPPLVHVNGSTFPGADADLKRSTPSVNDPDYADSIIDFVRQNAPDSFEGEPVNFGQTFFTSITPDMLSPDDQDAIDLLNLEVWGAPISHPQRDPNNPNFIYQRFQRGIMHYDATTGATRGILLADYLKQIMLESPDLPPDVRQDSTGSRFFKQYCPGSAGWVCRPDDLPATDLSYAFAEDPAIPSTAATANVSAAPPASGPVVSIVEFGYQPASLSVATGTTVRWTNLGRVPHTVTDAAGDWHSDLLRSGDTFDHRFDTPGTYTYVCSVHPGMQGTLTVTGDAVPAGPPPPAAAAPPPAAAAPPAAAPSNGSAVTIANSAFEPAALKVAVGAVVSWTNQDAVPHTVTSDPGVAPAFDSGMLKQGQTYSVTFNQAGTFTYFCAFHPNMHGRIMVQPPGG